jgi:hypothetical protein
VHELLGDGMAKNGVRIIVGAVMCRSTTCAAYCTHGGNKNENSVFLG